MAQTSGEIVNAVTESCEQVCRTELCKIRRAKLQSYLLIVQRCKKSTNMERYKILIRVGKYKSENRELVLRWKLSNIKEEAEADTSPD